MSISLDQKPKSPGREPSPAESARLLAAIRSGDRAGFSNLAEPHRRELLTHCYRMLGSLQDAEDLVQETFLRAWRRLETYEGRAPFRAWLYRIATNACLDALRRRPKRTLPQVLRAAGDPHEPPAPPEKEPIWLEPYPDELLAPVEHNPESRYEARESITLAFLVALHALPPRQRAVLILRDVLDWRAHEVADALEASVSAVNSMLYRARLTLAERYPERADRPGHTPESDAGTQALLQRYVRAWEAADIDGLVSLLKEDATFPMPPLPVWYRGRAAIRAFIATSILAGEAHGRWRLHPVRANAQPAFAWYQRVAAGDTYQAFAIQVLTVEGDLLADITTFGYPILFPKFGLPDEIEA